MTQRRTLLLSALAVATLTIGDVGHSCPARCRTASARCCRGLTRCCSKPNRARVCVRSQDEVWLVSTRHKNCCDVQQLCVRRYCSGRGFVDSSVDEYFAASDPQAIVTTFVHGNRVDPDMAGERGLRMYRKIANHACEHQRLRHVIWSWCSGAIRGPLRDAKIKAGRTYFQSYLLAQFVARHDSESRASLVGFSYGGRIILGAQHLLGQGVLCGRSLDTDLCAHTPKTRVVVWAPAMPADWIYPGGKNGRAFATTDRMLIYYNTRDPALRLYRHKMKESNAHALGFRGVCTNCLGRNASCVEQHNVVRSIGAHHDWTRYVESSRIICRTSTYALWRSVR